MRWAIQDPHKISILTNIGLLVAESGEIGAFPINYDNRTSLDRGESWPLQGKVI